MNEKKRKKVFESNSKVNLIIFASTPSRTIDALFLDPKFLTAKTHTPNPNKMYEIFFVELMAD